MIIGTPIAHNAQLPVGFVKSLMALFPGNNIHIFEESCAIPQNRNEIFEFARREGEDLLFIDSDMVFTRQDVSEMAEHLKTHDIVTGVAVMQFPGWPAAVFDEQLKPILVNGNELFEIGACGAAFLGISKKVIRDLTEPFRQREYGHGKMHGEDVSFCLKAKEAGYHIYCDPQLRIGHIKTLVKYYGE